MMKEKDRRLGEPYPVPPHVIETRITWMDLSVSNLCMASSRWSPDCLPSMRVNEMEAFFSRISIRSRVKVQ